MKDEQISMEENYVKVAIPKGKVAKWNDQGLLQLFDDKPKDVTERIKTFEDAVHELGDDNILVKEYNYYITHRPTDENNIDIVAYIKLRIVVAALNEGWKPQLDGSEQMWFPWFVFFSKDQLKEKIAEWKDDNVLQLWLFGGCTYDGSACGLASSNSLNAWSLSYADCSTRLALKSEALAIYCGKQFATLWAEYYTGKVCKPWREVTED